MTFSWEAMPGAARYELQITLPTGQVVSFDVENTSYRRYLESFRMGGTFTWQVTAFDSNGTVICISNPFTFIKSEPENPGGDGGGSQTGGGPGTSGNPGQSGAGAGG